ncbi:MAG TPA: SDR family oxidoreductase [Burkholderiaceae bacterium]
MQQPLALVTGASSGIGAVYADRLAQRGYALVLVARSVPRLEQLAATLRSEYGVNVEVLAADLTDDTDLLRVEARLQRADVTLLVNSAGVSTSGTLLDTDGASLAAMVQLNVVAPTRLANAAGRAMMKQGGGRIVNIASVLALVPDLFNGAYNATKAYLLSATEALRTELTPHGVYVQAVLPGITRTPMTAGAMKAIPAEMVMEPGDLVDAALAGMDLGEAVTIPSLPDSAQFERYLAARRDLRPHLSLSVPAARYRSAALV